MSKVRQQYVNATWPVKTSKFLKESCSSHSPLAGFSEVKPQEPPFFSGSLCLFLEASVFPDVITHFYHSYCPPSFSWGSSRDASVTTANTHHMSNSFHFCCFLFRYSLLWSCSLDIYVSFWICFMLWTSRELFCFFKCICCVFHSLNRGMKKSWWDRLSLY